LKAGLWFRRGRLFMVSPVRGDHRRFQAETPLIDLFKFAEPALLFGEGRLSQHGLYVVVDPKRNRYGMGLRVLRNPTGSMFGATARD
jgi:hypothetical protein